MNAFFSAMEAFLSQLPWVADELPWIAFLLQTSFAWLAVWLSSKLIRRTLQSMCRPYPFLRRLLDDVFSTVRALLFLLLMHVLLRGLPSGTFGVGQMTSLTALLVVAAMTIALTRAVSSVAATIIELNPVTVEDNLQARRILTQTRVLSRTVIGLIVVIGTGFALMTIPALRQIGTSLLASAGLAGLAVGLAAKPIFSNLLAGLQLALTQPIRLDDVVIIKGEWGRIEEITGTYVVLRIWDQRRLIVPLNWFIENPFENWTRHDAEILGTVLLWLDYRLPVDALRAEAERFCQASPEWDGRLVETQVVDANERAIQVRVLVSAADSGLAWKLRCNLREALVAFVQKNYPDCLPRARAEIAAGAEKSPAL